jgi:hypothetical protein
MFVFPTNEDLALQKLEPCGPGLVQFVPRSGGNPMIRKLSTGEYRLYSRKINPKTGKRRNLGTFKSRAAAEKHERDVQYFKRH